MPQEGNRGGIRPLQVIQEEDKRMLWAYKRFNKVLEGDVKAVLLFLGGELLESRLATQHKRSFRNHTHNELPIFTHCFLDFFAPYRESLFTLPKQLLDERTKGFDQRGVRNLALGLHIPSAHEIAVLSRRWNLELIDQTRL